MTLIQERKEQVRKCLATLADCFRTTDTKTLCEIFREFPNLSGCINLILNANISTQGGKIDGRDLDLTGGNNG